MVFEVRSPDGFMRRFAVSGSPRSGQDNCDSWARQKIRRIVAERTREANLIAYHGDIDGDFNL